MYTSSARNFDEPQINVIFTVFLYVSDKADQCVWIRLGASVKYDETERFADENILMLFCVPFLRQDTARIRDL